MPVTEITNFEQYIKFKTKNEKCIIFYGEKSCEACSDIEPLYNRIAKRYSNIIAFGHVDIDICKLDFTAIPIFVLINNGKQINHMRGANKLGLKEFIRKGILYK